MELIKPLGIGLLAIAGLGGVYLVSETSSDLISLHESGEYKDNSNSFGHKFAYYFLSTTRSENDSEWRGKVTTANELGVLTGDSFFKTLMSSFTVNKLKTECKNNYDKSNFNHTNDKDKWKEVWDFCSFGNEKPTTIDEAKDSIKDMSEAGSERSYTSTSTDTNNKFGTKLKTSAISTYDKNNDWFWDIREEEFTAGSLDTSGETSAYFNKDKANRQTIKLLCRDAYEKTAPTNGTETENNPKEENVKKYCTLDGK